MPADSLGAWAISNADPGRMMTWLKETVTVYQTKNRSLTTWDQLQADLGQDPAEWAALFNGQAYGSTRSAKGEIQSFLAVGLANSDGFANWYKSRWPEAGQPVEVEGVTFHQIDGAVLGWDQRWLYLANDSDSATFHLKFAAGGGDSIADSALFKEGLAELKVKEYDAFALLNFDSMAEEFKRVKQEEINPQTLAELFSFRYALVTWRYEGWEVNAILAPQEKKFGVASKLCRPGGVTGAALRQLSDDSKNYVCADLQWIQNAALGLLDLHPSTRSYSGMITLAIALNGNPWNSFTGEVAVTTDLPALVEEALKDKDSKKKDFGNLALAFPSNDLKGSRKFLSKVVSLPPDPAEEVDLGDGARLRLIDSNPSNVLFLLGQDADKLTNGGGHKVSAVKKALEWGDGGVVYLDHWDATESVDLLLTKLKSEEDSESKALVRWLDFLRQEFDTLDGTTCFAASEKGLKYRASGPVNSLLLAGWAAVAAAIERP